MSRSGLGQTPSSAATSALPSWIGAGLGAAAGWAGGAADRSVLFLVNVIQALPAEGAERQRKRVARKAGKSGRKLDARTTTVAGYLILATSLSAQAQPRERIIEMYRNRWQIELGFKRLKTLGGLDRLPAIDPALARTWLLAQLIVAVLTDELAATIVGFPP